MVGTLAAVIVLVLGGTRSGKSELAEQLAARLPAPVSYLATATLGHGEDLDEDLAMRVACHRVRRPSDWRTLEVGDEQSGALPEALAVTSGTVLVDSLGTWVAARPDFDVDVEGLCEALRRRQGDTVIVSDEVGLGAPTPRPRSGVASGTRSAPPTGRSPRRPIASSSLSPAGRWNCSRSRTCSVVKRVERAKRSANYISWASASSPDGDGVRGRSPRGVSVSEGDDRWLGAFRGARGSSTVAGGPARPVPAATAWFPLVGLLVGCTIGVGVGGARALPRPWPAGLPWQPTWR